jgi:hypothetical protein
MSARQAVKKVAEVFIGQAERKQKAAKRQGFHPQAHFTHPEDGRDTGEGGQAKAFFHEVSKPRKA